MLLRQLTTTDNAATNTAGFIITTAISNDLTTNILQILPLILPIQPLLLQQILL